MAHTYLDEEGFSNSKFNVDFERAAGVAKKVAAGVLLLGAAGAAVGGIASCSHSYLEEKSVVATVTDKAIHVDGDKDSGVSSTYMIYTDHGVFTNGDSLVKGKFNSSDVYGQLKVGCTYKFNYHGFRNSVMSMYPNIDSFTIVPSATQCTTVPKI